jgi:uncharacterized heparinase superfamily protein
MDLSLINGAMGKHFDGAGENGVHMLITSARQALRRTRAFAARGPAYVAAYARWRAVRLGASVRQHLYSPAWAPLPALPAVGVAAGMSLVEAGAALAAHLAAREHPCFHFSGAAVADIVHRVPPEQRTHTRRVAEALMRGRHTYRGVTVAFDAEPDWRHAPSDSVDWRWDLNRHYWLPTLARAWRYSGDDAYADYAARLLRHWMVHNPPDVRSPVWRPFEVATRLNNWVWGLFLLMDCPTFVREGTGHLWQGLIAQARYLYRHLERHVVNNHLLIEAKTLAMLGLLFPEVPGAARWLQAGLDTMWIQVRRQFHPDGVHVEQATQYHALCTGELWEMLSLLRRNGHPIPSDVLARFEAAVAFQTAIVKPDGHIPLFGDSARHDLHRRFDPRWALVWLGKDGAPAEPPNEETRWLLGTTSLPAGSGPPPTSRAFLHGGYVVMRDADRYLVLDCGPFGDEAVSSHAHADALSLEVCAFGQTLLTDSGGYSYHAAPEWRNYFRSSRAHNTVVVDDQNQSELIGKRLVHNPARAKLLQWLTTPLADWAVAEHDGYTRLSSPVTHRRRILFVKPHYWLLLDSLLGDGRHRLDWHFHLPPGACWSAAPEDGVVRAAADGVGLSIAASWSSGLSAQVVEGQVCPPQGWVSLESGERLPAPHLVFTREGDLPAHVPIALVPHPSDQAVFASLRALSVDAHWIALALDTSDTRDDVGIALQDSPILLQVSPFEAEAQVLLVRHTKNQPSVALAIGAREISVAGRRIWAGRTSRWVSLMERDAEWYVAEEGMNT